MSDSYLLLWLEAPLQSWGHDSKFGRRDSLDFPTKSGVLGLICCARGVNDAQIEWLSEYSSMDMQVMSYCRKHGLSKAMMRQPMLEDFQMVGSGYNVQDPWESLLVPRTNEGKKAVGGGSKITYKYYLQDMAFAVALQIPQSMIENVSQSLQAPIWDLYLGRKNCAPTEFIYQGIHASAEEAFMKASAMAEEKNLSAYSHILEGAHDGEVCVLNDVPLKFGRHKLYRDRQVTVKRILQDNSV